jgi:reactive chlorine resistance protein C
MTAIATTNPRTTTTTPDTRLDQVLAGLGARAEALGGHALRYGLVLILLWIGGMKFTAYEAEGIRPFVENSPLFAWTYPVFGVQGLSNILGATEILVGLLIAARPWLPRVSAVGSLLAVGMFLSTLSFLVTTPGTWAAEVGGFPAISVLGQFLIKDVALLATAVWSFGEAVRATRSTLAR